MKMKFSALMICLFISGSAICFGQGLPIKPTRMVSFATDEGSNMNVDVSPDGETLVFDLLGELFTVPATGGSATQLTHGMAVNMNPVWSPDGKRLAYISDASGSIHLTVRNLAGAFQETLDPNGAQLDFLSYRSILWSPDGNFVLMDSDQYGITGGKLPRSKDLNGIIRFSTDGTIGYHLDSLGRIAGYNFRMGAGKALTSPIMNKLVTQLSADLRWAAYTKDTLGKRALIIRDLKKDKDRILVSSLFNNERNGFYHFAFSPDSRYIYIAYKGKIHRIEVQTGNNIIIPFKAQANIAMGKLDYHTFSVDNKSPFQIKYARSANASPDGKHLVFATLDKVWIMDLPNGKPHVLTIQNINQFQPVFSPDSKWVAYVTWCDTTGGQLWRVPVAGGKPEHLTNSASQYQRPAWSPDGKNIAVVKGGPIDSLHAIGQGDPELLDRDIIGLGQLQLISVNSKNMRPVADSVPLLNQVSFSADGSNVIYRPSNDWMGNYYSYKGEHRAVLMVSRDIATYAERILAVGPPNPVADGISSPLATLSPDQKYIVYSRGEDLYLAPFNKLTQPNIIDDVAPQQTAIRFAHGLDAYWENGGKQICWTYGNQFFRIQTQKILDAAQRYLQIKQPPTDNIIRVKVQPDQVTKFDITVPANYAKGTVVLKNARILTMKGEQIINKGMIIIKNGRFSYIGKNNLNLIPKSAKVIDLNGKTIMPGFVDLHLHLRLSQDVFPQQSWMFLVNLAYGVTTARDPSTGYGHFGYEELLKSGQMIGPRLYASGFPVRPNDVTLDESEDARSIIRQRKYLGGTFIKQYMQPTRRQREWVLQASDAALLNMTNEGEYPVQPDIGQLKDGSSGIEHNPDWGDAYKDILTLFAKSGTYFTPTLQVRPTDGGLAYFDSNYWHKADEKMKRFMPDGNLNDIITETYTPKDSAELMQAARIDARIRKAGGKVTLGSHGNNEGIGVHNELWALQMGGLTNMQALQAATIMGAEGLGIQKDVGSIEVGKIADLIILNSNPLDDIHNSRDIKYVMKDGILYDADTLDEIWPIKKKCPDWHLHGRRTGATKSIKNFNSGGSSPRPGKKDQDDD